jgi:uncharacterized phage-like protein YoqJ
MFKIPTPEEEIEIMSKIKQRQELYNHTACFTGHRPDKLGGYDMKNPVILKLKEKLLEVIEKLIKEEGINRFISGGALGADQVAFWCVHILQKKYPEIKNIVAIPFAKQDALWNQEQKYWYQKMLKLADEIIYVDEEYQRDKETPIGEYSSKKLQIRNEYMVDNSRIVVAVYDGSKGGTSNCLWYARHLGRTIYRLNPKRDFTLEITYGW